MSDIATGLHPQARVDEYVAKGWWTDETIDGLFWQRVAERQDALAVTDPLNRESLDGETPRRLSWNEIGAEVTWLAAQLLELGIGRGDVIGMQLPNSIEQLEVYLAAWSIGATVSPLAMQYREHELIGMAGQAEFTAYVCGNSFGDRTIATEVAAVRDQIPTVRTVISIGLAEVAPIDGVIRLAPRAATGETGAGEPSAVMTTGGWCFATSVRSSASRALLLCVIRFRAHGAGVSPSARISSRDEVIVVSHSSSCSAVRQLGAGNAPIAPARHAATTRSGPDTRNMGAATIGVRSVLVNVSVRCVSCMRPPCPYFFN